MSSSTPPDPAASFPESQLPGPALTESLRPHPASRGWREWRLPTILFCATLLSTTYAGLFNATGEIGLFRLGRAVAAHPSLLLQAISFSFTLMAILLAHEFGHYLACRYYGISCTPPYFIPFPLSFFVGTFGAFIRIKSPFPNRRALFDVGIAGPLAGFVFVVPALLIGIHGSTLVPKGSIPSDISFGEPILFRWLGALLLGYSPEAHDMFGPPVVMAAWFGLLVTSLNLLPIWQLDGAHVAYSLLGRESQRKLSLAAILALALIAIGGWPIRSPAYIVFAILLAAFGMRSRFYHPPTLSDDERIGPGRMVLAIILLLILVVSFTPVPFSMTQ